MRRWYVWLPISVALLGLVVWRTRPWEAAALASHLHPWPLVAAMAVNLAVVALWAERSRSLMASVGSPLPVAALVPITSFANTVNNLTPASTGEVLRALILRRRYGVPYARSTAVILVERLWAIGLMLVSALAAAVGTLVDARPGLVAAAWLAAVGAAFVPSIAYALRLHPGRVLARWADPHPEGARFSRARRLAHVAAEIDERLHGVLTSPSRSAHFVATTALIFAGFAVQVWLVLLALGDEVPIAGAWAALGLATVAGVLSALPFGLGAADAVLVLLLGIQGVDAAAAGAAALLLRAVATLPLGLLGTASWIWLNRGGDLPTPTDAIATFEADTLPGARPADGAGPPGDTGAAGSHERPRGSGEPAGPAGQTG